MVAVVVLVEPCAGIERVREGPEQLAAVGERIWCGLLGEAVQVVVHHLERDDSADRGCAVSARGEGGERRRDLGGETLLLQRPQCARAQLGILDLDGPRSPARELGAHLRRDGRPVARVGDNERDARARQQPAVGEDRGVALEARGRGVLLI